MIIAVLLFICFSILFILGKKYEYFNVIKVFKRKYVIKIKLLVINFLV